MMKGLFTEGKESFTNQREEERTPQRAEPRPGCSFKRWRGDWAADALISRLERLAQGCLAGLRTSLDCGWQRRPSSGPDWSPDVFLARLLTFADLCFHSQLSRGIWNSSADLSV